MDDSPRESGWAGRAGSAVLVVRVWREPDAEPGFRARVTWTRDVTLPGDTVVLTEPEAVVSLLRNWLAGLAR